MARRTNLYQAPRSPLIQGRTRWERPLWQAWLAGAGIGAVVLLAWEAVAASRGIRVEGTAAALWLLAATLVGAGIGTALARLWGWRNRWLGSAVGACGAIAAVMLALSYWQPR